ncbi:MAG: DUF445 family protein, partial [Bacteroidetes bacterium]|nr:DUF445 family protein [Bacteroidota bacterium]
MPWLTFLQDNWELLTIPLVSAFVGWITNVLALKMTFYPLEYYGLGPWIGWQGIIPSKATRMAEKSVDLMLGKLINLEDQFSRLDSAAISEMTKPELLLISRKILDRIMRSQAPGIWNKTPETIKDQIAQQIADDLPEAVELMIADLKDNIDELFDVKTTVIQTLIQDKALLNEIFLTCGREEFKFIERSGFYFGFLFGLIQMTIFFFYDPWWVLPLAGGIVGYATNWLALRMIFSPLHSIKIGPWNIQGLFMKRQKEVAGEYAKIVSERVLNTTNIFNNILYGKRKPKLIDIITKRIDTIMHHTTQNFRFLLEIFAQERYIVAKNIADYYFIDHFPILIHQISPYAEEALDLENTFKEKMSNLSPAEFQGFLRPVFQED